MARYGPPQIAPDSAASDAGCAAADVVIYKEAGDDLDVNDRLSEEREEPPLAARVGRRCGHVALGLRFIRLEQNRNWRNHRWRGRRNVGFGRRDVGYWRRELREWWSRRIRRNHD